MPTVVQIGAGAVGRGFLGQLWNEAGYEVVLVDANETLVSELNRRGFYPLHLISDSAEQRIAITPVRAVSAHDTDAVARELSNCIFAASAVGARLVETIARTLIVPGLVARVATGNGPLNIILCENGLTVRDDFLRGIGDHAADTLGVVETVVARMVPEARPESDDSLIVSAEPYRELPINAAQWLGAFPVIPGIIAVPGSAFHEYERRKLFTHNGGHAVLAYHGYLRGHQYLYECAEDDPCVKELRGFWQEIDTAMRKRSGSSHSLFAPDAIQPFEADLLQRFRNRRLGDTVPRVARDPIRKLARQDRLVGAALLCHENGVEPIRSVRAIAAALRYDSPKDTAAQQIQASLREGGIALALKRFAGLSPDHPLVSRIKEAYAASVAK